MKRIAIVGAGFSGLALAYFLKDQASITLFDAHLPHAGSRVAHGLCHPFVGQNSKLNDRGREAMRKSHRLFDAASSALGKRCYRANGIARFALDEKQLADFKEAASLHKELKWFDKEESPYPAVHYPGIFIEEGLLVSATDYLKGMEMLLQLPIEKRNVSRGELTDFDLVIFAIGGEAKALFPEVPLRLIKGQLIQLPFSKKLPFPLMSKKYLAEEGGVLTIGATYERTFNDVKVDPETAIREILPEALQLLPELSGAPVIHVEAGVRCFTPDRKPLFKQVSEKEWLFTGFGSKGLLYHALFAEEAAQALMRSF